MNRQYRSLLSLHLSVNKFMLKKQHKTTEIKTLVLITVASILLIVHVLFIWLSGNQVKTIQLLREQLKVFEKDQQLIKASETLSNQYAREISIISKVFPTEGTMPEFIRTLETLLKNVSLEYSLKFNSLQPIPEQDKLYIPLTITSKLEFDKLIKLFSDLETIPYMTHITQFTINVPEGITKPLSVQMVLKLYVKKPFSSQ